MAQTPEGKVKAKVDKILAKFNCYCVKPVTGGYGSSGVPDILVLLDGKFIGIECKAGKGEPTLLQIHHLKQIVANGGYSMIINETNLPQLEEVLCKIQQKQISPSMVLTASMRSGDL